LEIFIFPEGFSKSTKIFSKKYFLFYKVLRKIFQK